LVIIQFWFFFAGLRGGQSVQRLCWFIPGVAMRISPIGLPDVSQASLERASGGMGALLFSQCNVAWRSFVQAGGSGCQSFDSSWCFLFCQV
jgi:hypothetical protein